MTARIHWNSRTIHMPSSPKSQDAKFFSRAVYVVCERQGYKDVVLDFTECESLFQNFMVPLIAVCRLNTRSGSEFDIVMPENSSLKSLFHNANWSHLINPRVFEPTTHDGGIHLPATTFTDSNTHFDAVNGVMDIILGQLPTLTRKSLSALEWALNETTDNVLNHAECPVGGVIQASVYSDSGNVEFTVADAGIGIPKSLGEPDHERALERAIEEGVTRDSKTNQGNGLYGSYRVAALSGGKFEIASGKADLLAEGKERVEFKRNASSAFFSGTVVSARIDCSRPDLIEEALNFNGNGHAPGADYIDFRYGSDSLNEFRLVVKEECPSHGSRDAGRVMFNKIIHILNDAAAVLRVDFEGVGIISSSFADEVFGKLFVQIGPTAYSARVKIENADRTIIGLIDRAIVQRTRTPG